MTIIDRRHSVSEGTAIKAPCRAATTANIALAGEQAIDGVALVEGDRALVNNQTDATQNGIYEVSTGNWTRTRDFDGAFDIVEGTVVRVTNGSSNIGYWEVTTANPIAVGATALAFTLTTNSISGVSAFVQTLLDDTTATAFLATLGVAVSSFVPAGTVFPFAGASAPTGFLLSYGQAVSRTTYAALFAVVGTTFGTGDGSTTFNVPDLRGRVVAGTDNMGGTTADRLQSGDLAAVRHTLGGAGGTSAHTLTEAQMPAHTHVTTVTDPGHSHPYSHAIGNNTGGPDGATNKNAYTTNSTSSALTGVTVSNASAGGSSSHNNIQPTFVLSYIIKA